MHARLSCLIVVIAALVASAAVADGPPRGAPRLLFATVEEARTVLTRRDDFVERLSPFDRRARLQRDAAVDTEAYLAFVGASVRAWPDDARAAVERAYDELRPALDAMPLPWPPTVLLIHTSGAEEAGAAYTRSDAIVLPPGTLSPAARAGLPRLLAHELFHVLSRHNPELKDRAYAAIGFHACGGEVTFPSALRERRITNPDAPRNDHCIDVEVDGARRSVVPLLYAREGYEAQSARPFFDYLELRLLALDAGPAGPPKYDDAHPRLVAVDAVKGFFEQIGRNTGYIIHPEEILADNFAVIVLGSKDARSPDVLARIAAALRPPSR